MQYIETIINIENIIKIDYKILSKKRLKDFIIE